MRPKELDTKLIERKKLEFGSLPEQTLVQIAATDGSIEASDAALAVLAQRRSCDMPTARRMVFFRGKRLERAA